jgi:glutamate N-acetyltransferase/amino-acid N-acetyltransferase
VSSFFASRWVERPGQVSELDGGLAAGFRAAGFAGGIKPNGSLDVGLVVCDEPEVTSAARFTRSGVLAAPVLVTMERCRLDGVRAIVVNSGNANAATGRRGLDDAAKMQGAGAIAAGAGEDTVAVASTGVIGVPLPMDALVRGIAGVARSLRADGDRDFAAAIQTTDAFEKRTSLEVTLGGGTVHISAQAKGAGMISPRFATLLCFVQTDAAMSPQTCELLLSVTVKRSFERISVDGQLSTNDTVILQASGSSGVRIEPETDDEVRFGEALDALLRQLALLILHDGESDASSSVGATSTPPGPPPAPSPIRRWSRRRCTAGTRIGGGSPRRSGWRSRGRPRSPSTSRSRASRCAPGAAWWPSIAARSSARWRGRRSSTRSACPAPAPRPSSTSPISVTST